LFQSAIWQDWTGLVIEGCQIAWLLSFTTGCAGGWFGINIKNMNILNSPSEICGQQDFLTRREANG
jgi:hypothetical protein